MKYIIIGAGGTGGCIGAYMAKNNMDVTLIARGEHLNKIKSEGLKIENPDDGEYVVKVKASDMDSYNETPDVIFVCVKGYSINSVVPFIKRVATKDTIVIPILNIYGTGAHLQEMLPEILVTDGCIYVASQIKEPGVIWMNGSILRVVYGVRNEAEYTSVLEDIKRDLEKSKIEAVLSDNIRRDALLKFSYVSPAAACGQYYDVPAKDMQVEGKIRETFKLLIKEIDTLANAMNIDFGEDIVKRNLNILDNLAPTASTSMQRDVAKGGESEMDGLICEVVRMGHKYNVKVPTYEMIAKKVANFEI